MKYMWAPWRMEYIRIAKQKGCFFCATSGQDQDARNYILHRSSNNFVIMNSYPYNPGHLMVAPYRHTGNLGELTDSDLHDHFELVSFCIKVLKQAFNPDGFNTGMNLGRIAGAGVVDHAHTHIVPRWEGDTNFMPVIAETKVVNQALAETYQKLKDVLSLFDKDSAK